MTEYVWLTVTGEQTHPDGTRETNTTRSLARHEIMPDGSHVLIAEEMVQEQDGPETRGQIRRGLEQNGQDKHGNPDTGDRQGSAAHITVTDHRITVEKTGEYASRMVFETGLEHALDYRTPYGTLPMTIHTSHVAALVVNDNLHAHAKYELRMQRDYPVQCAVTIRTEPVQMENSDPDGERE